MRVHELAKELGISSKQLLTSLEEMGLGGGTASSSVPDEAVPRLRASGGKAVKGRKPKDVLEAPTPKKRSPAAKKAAAKKAAAKKAVEPPAGSDTSGPEIAEAKAAGAKTATKTSTKTATKTAAKTAATKRSATKSAPTKSSPTTARPAAAKATEAPPEAEAPAPAPESSPTQVVAATAVATAAEPVAEPVVPALPILKVGRGATAQELADKMSKTVAEVVKTLFGLGEMASATTSLSDDALQLVAHELGYEAEIVTVDEDLSDEEPDEEVDEALLQPRPPVVTIMGHVDHGKTKLLDAIREANVVEGEFGGITQHIGAYQAHVGEREITFIDTPGHEAFTAMRARGAQVTDIAVLVVAADDGVMPQTVEALDHAKAAGVPIVVAVNKVDKEDADPTRVRQQLVERGIVPVEWGGDHEFVDVSAKARTNLDSLLDTILIVADLAELKANPEGRARGAVIEAHLDKGRGPVATVLVQRGSLEVGDALVAGTAFAKIRAMQDENGLTVKRAGPSKPVLLLGWSAVPTAGDDFREVADEREARHVAQERESRTRAAELVTPRATTLQDLLAQAKDEEVPELNLVLKADVQGSLGALTDSFLKIPQDEVRIRIMRSGAGGITENDVQLAMASNAIVVGFNVRPDAGARALAEEEGVDVRLYRVIYDAIADVRQSLSGLLSPTREEIEKGQAEVRELFRVPKLGVVAGCYVTAGTITRDSRARVVRDGVVAYDGTIGSLRRFKDDVKEVAQGYECGIGIANFQDIKEGDVIEAYEVREVARSL